MLQRKKGSSLPSSIYPVMKWMDIWLVQDKNNKKTHPSAVTENNNKRNTPAGMCVFLCLLISFKIFLFFLYYVPFFKKKLLESS